MNISKMKYADYNKKTFQLAIHIVSWLLVFGFPLLLFDRNTNSINWHEYFNHSIVTFILFVIFYAEYLWLVPKYLFKDKIKEFIISNILIIGILSTSLHLWMENMSAPPPPNFNKYIPPHWIFFLRDIMLMTFAAGLGTVIKTSLRWRETEERLIESEREKTEMELKNLKNQLNPHFLLNTLNNIYALIAFNKDKAQEAVQDLSKLLRHVLYENQQAFVPLERELDFIKNYVALMKIRIPKNVKLEINLQDSDKKNILIAPLIFISLIENAFKHGISPIDESFIKINISTSSNNEVICYIENSNFPKNQHDKSGSGIGLEQVKKRLDLIYPGKHIWQKGISHDGKVYSSKLIIKTEEV